MSVFLDDFCLCDHASSSPSLSAAVVPLLWTLQKAQPTLLPSHCPSYSSRGKSHLLRPFPGPSMPNCGCPPDALQALPSGPYHHYHPSSLGPDPDLTPPAFTHGPSVPIAEGLPLKSRMLLFLHCAAATVPSCMPSALQPGTGLFLCPQPASPALIPQTHSPATVTQYHPPAPVSYIICSGRIMPPLRPPLP